MVDDVVVAPVLSQPSLPLPLNEAQRADLGISDADLDRVRSASAEGTCVLGLRFTGAWPRAPSASSGCEKSSETASISVELDSSPGNAADHPKSALRPHRAPPTTARDPDTCCPRPGARLS